MRERRQISFNMENEKHKKAFKIFNDKKEPSDYIINLILQDKEIMDYESKWESLTDKLEEIERLIKNKEFVNIVKNEKFIPENQEKEKTTNVARDLLDMLDNWN